VPSSVPDAPPHVLGAINLRGVVAPLLNLAACLGVTTRTESERNVIIVVEIDETLFGLLVDAMSDIIEPSGDEMQSPPDAAKSGDQSYVRASTLVGEKMVRILSLASVLPPVADAA
jgi:purine-binding chemotaxis protein CheW